MKSNIKKVILCGSVLMWFGLQAQTFTWISSTEGNLWQTSKVKLQQRAADTPILTVAETEKGTEFKAWGTCFNELDWDALNLLPRTRQQIIMKQLFAPDGDLHFTMGRIPMNASDYARDWYSCDEVPGDFRLKHFNINRDKQAVIPFIKAAQEQNPDMTFWASPWSPPTWMKINHDYPVRSSNYNEMDPVLDFALFEDNTEKDTGVFPEMLAVNDYFIQEPRYLSAYALYFCKFIDAYKEQGIPIGMVMYQNEAYSYTPYSGCAWTAEGTIRFNVEYLSPALRKHHPDVALYMGTINTNRYDYIDKILSAPHMDECIQGVGFQWEGGQILSEIRAKYPQYKYVSSESECGWGSFDWRGAEHTFHLINHYLSNGCEEYNFWNAILCDNGESPWGWKQNALIRVDSKAHTATYTPEYYAVKHYSNVILPGSRVLTALSARKSNTPIMVLLNPEGKYIVVAGNFNEEAETVTIRLGERYLNVTLLPHSFNTFKMK